MASQTTGSEFWSLRSPLAQLRAAELTAAIDVTGPHLGLHALRLGSAPLSGRLLRIAWETGSRTRQQSSTVLEPAWPAELADAYVRGPDLVAAYQQAADWPYAPQIYWRAAPTDRGTGVLASVTLMVSLQTALLDSYPCIEVASSIEAEEVVLVTNTDDDIPNVRSLDADEQQTLGQQTDGGCVVGRLPGGQFSYAEISPANDFRQLVVERDGRDNCRTRWELFSDFLEKGVIRRARIELVFLPRENDVQNAAACCRALQTRPLPLTT